jgi:hypothetical protein
MSFRAMAEACAVEGLLVIGLDDERRLSGVAVNPRHRSLSFVKVWELRALADELGARSLMIAMFPTGPGAEPSKHERWSFADLRDRAQRAHVDLLDCLVVRGGRCWSLAA